MAYLGFIVSYAFLIKIQDGKCIQRTAFHLDTYEEIQLDKVETVDVTCQTLMVTQAKLHPKMSRKGNSSIGYL